MAKIKTIFNFNQDQFYLPCDSISLFDRDHGSSWNQCTDFTKSQTI